MSWGAERAGREPARAPGGRVGAESGARRRSAVLFLADGSNAPESTRPGASEC
jgi:hypothetical protein